jgi:hypothetical protein
MLAAFLLVAVFAAVRSAASSAGGTPVAVLSADALLKEYQADLAAADVKYMGKTVDVTGVSGKVQKDDEGRYFLAGAEGARVVKGPGYGKVKMVDDIEELHRRAMEAAFNTKRAPGVILYIDSGDLTAFADLGGRTVTVRGRCKGTQKDRRTDPEEVVIVEGCRPVVGR